MVKLNLLSPTEITLLLPSPPTPLSTPLLPPAPLPRPLPISPIEHKVIYDHVSLLLVVWLLFHFVCHTSLLECALTTEYPSA